MSGRSRIVVLGANPARQKMLIFERFVPEEVNRADKAFSFASGKGINFCRATKIWGVCATVLVQFSGGESGKYIENELENERLNFLSVKVDFVRNAITCLDQANRTMTEILEPSATPNRAALEQAANFIGGLQKNTSALAICGTLPGNTDPEFYCQAAKMAVKLGLPVLVDAYLGVEALLAMPGKIFLKINASELRKLAGEDKLDTAAVKVLKKFPAVEILAVTNGGGEAFLFRHRSRWRYRLPEMSDIVSPLGAGDTVSAVFLSELLTGKSAEDAFLTALAAGSASILELQPGKFDPAKAVNLALKIEMKKLETSRRKI